MFDGPDKTRIRNSTASIVLNTTANPGPHRITPTQGHIAELYNVDFQFREDLQNLVENFQESKTKQILTKEERQQLNTFLSPFKNLATCFECKRKVAPKDIDAQIQLANIAETISRPVFFQTLSSIAQCTAIYVDFLNFLLSLDQQLQKRITPNNDAKLNALRTDIKQALNRQIIQPVQYLPRIPMVLKEINSASKKTNGKTFEAALAKIENHIQILNRKYDQRNLLSDLVIKDTDDLSLSDILFENQIVLGAIADSSNISKFKFEYRKWFFNNFLFNWRQNQLLEKYLGLSPQDTQTINRRIKQARQQRAYRHKLSKYNNALASTLAAHAIDLDRTAFHSLMRGAKQNDGQRILLTVCSDKKLMERISLNEKGAIFNECIKNKAITKKLSYLHVASRIKKQFMTPQAKTTITKSTPVQIKQQPVITFELPILEKKIRLFQKKSTQAMKSTIIPIMPLRIRTGKLIREALNTMKQIDQLIASAPRELQAILKTRVASPLKQIAISLADQSQEILNSQTPVTKTDELVASIQAAASESLRYLLTEKNKPSQSSPSINQNSLHMRQASHKPASCA